MTQHTPGPWVTDRNQHGECHVMDEFGIAIADMAVDYSSIKKIEEHEANARLIAAAPELLEALKDMLDGHEDACTGYGEGAADKARAAIAKATGGDV